MTCPHYTEGVHPDYCVFCREEELRAEIERLTASLECWKGRAMNYVTDIERLRAPKSESD
jgi:hypothetical protein